MKRRGKTILAVAAAAAIGFAAWLGHIGYFGGQVYFEMAPKAAAGAAPRPPLVPPRTVAVLFSGDMGFRVGMGPKIAERLSADGVPVLGVSSLVYFRNERTPAQVRAFIADAARRALAFAHADRLILIGQSFGADMLQVGSVGLPDDLRAKVQMVALVVPGNTVIFRASPGELFNWVKPDAPAWPTARQLTWAPVVCVQGVEEADSLCPQLNLGNVKRIALPGGHPLHRDADALYAALKAQIEATGIGMPKITKSSEARHLAATPPGADQALRPANRMTGP